MYIHVSVNKNCTLLKKNISENKTKTNSSNC